MSFKSDEVNYLVYRYLLECGYAHSAFKFANESLLKQSNINGDRVQPAALESLIKRGIKYTQVENSIAEDGSEGEVEDLGVLEAVIPPAELQEARCMAAPAVLSTKSGQQLDNQQLASAANTTQQIRQQTPADETVAHISNGSTNGAAAGTGAPNMDLANHTDELADMTNGAGSPFALEATILERNSDTEVYACAWNPTCDLLASGSADSYAKLWNMNDNTNNTVHFKVLQCTEEEETVDGRKLDSSVTAIEWRCDGERLATGTKSGFVKVWSKDGCLVNTAKPHKELIYTLKWNNKGNYIVTGAQDGTTSVLDASSGNSMQQFAFHSGPVLDVDWQHNDSFVSCSSDTLIHMCYLGLDQPVKTFHGHTKDVNSVQWDPRGELLASCSDDMTVKIWNLKNDTCIYDLKAHNESVFTIRWSPTGPGTANPNANLMLASGSFDSTVRLWDTECGTCIHTLTGHKWQIFTLAFSPDGKYLASGSQDKYVHIWSVQSGSLVHSYLGTGVITEVCWNQRGDKVAACDYGGSVFVLDLRK